VPAATNLYLGDTVDEEGNGQPIVAATGDNTHGVPNDEDSVTAVGVWQNGTNGGVVQVKVGAGAGWLCGYLDFNRNGSFADSGENFISQVVSNTGGTGGVYTVAFDIPTGTVSSATSTWLYARFRLFDSEPFVLRSANTVTFVRPASPAILTTSPTPTARTASAVCRRATTRCGWTPTRCRRG